VLNNAVILLSVALSYVGVLTVNHSVTKQAVAKAHKSGFLAGYRKCAVARRTIVRPPTTNTPTPNIP
jgi:hypothetical protein